MVMFAVSGAPRRRPDRARYARFASLLVAGALAAGCGQDAQEGSPPNGANLTTGEGAGLMLPPDFKPVDLPVETRKEIFKEVHLARVRAQADANLKLPMDESHLPVGDKDAFAKRVADFNEI